MKTYRLLNEKELRRVGDEYYGAGNSWQEVLIEDVGRACLEVLVRRELGGFTDAVRMGDLKGLAKPKDCDA